MPSTSTVTLIYLVVKYMKICSLVKGPGHLAWGQGTADRIRPRPGAWRQGTAELIKIVQYSKTLLWVFLLSRDNSTSLECIRIQCKEE